MDGSRYASSLVEAWVIVFVKGVECVSLGSKACLAATDSDDFALMTQTLSNDALYLPNSYTLHIYTFTQCGLVLIGDEDKDKVSASTQCRSRPSSSTSCLAASPSLPPSLPPSGSSLLPTSYATRPPSTGAQPRGASAVSRYVPFFPPSHPPFLASSSSLPPSLPPPFPHLEILRTARRFYWPNDHGESWRDVLRREARKEFEQAREERDPLIVARLLVVGRDCVMQTQYKVRLR